jgi:hypothetical protein
MSTHIEDASTLERFISLNYNLDFNLVKDHFSDIKRDLSTGNLRYVDFKDLAVEIESEKDYKIQLSRANSRGGAEVKSTPNDTSTVGSQRGKSSQTGNPNRNARRPSPRSKSGNNRGKTSDPRTFEIAGGKFSSKYLGNLVKGRSNKESVNLNHQTVKVSTIRNTLGQKSPSKPNKPNPQNKAFSVAGKPVTEKYLRGMVRIAESSGRRQVTMFKRRYGVNYIKNCLRGRFYKLEPLN